MRHAWTLLPRWTGAAAAVAALSVEALHFESVLSRKSLFEAVVASQTLASSSIGRLVLSNGPVSTNEARIVGLQTTGSTEYFAGNFVGRHSGDAPTLSSPPWSQSSAAAATWLDKTLTTSIGKRYIRPAALNYRPQNIGRLGNGLDSQSSEIYYPPFMFGSWKVTATLLRTVTNDNNNNNVALPASSQINPWLVVFGGDAASGTSKEPMINTCTTFEQHCFSTLANTWQNQLTVNLGLGVPTPKVIADRAYNARAVYTAYYQQQQQQPFNDDTGLVLQSVSWDYRNSPTKLVLDYNNGNTDTTHTINVAIVSRQSEYATRIMGDDTFATHEQMQTTVTTSGGKSTTIDAQVTTEFHFISDNVVNAVCRVAVFGSLLPKSSTLNALSSTSMTMVDYGHDYQWTMQRILTDFNGRGDGNTAQADEDDANTRRRPCVTTPNDFVQCF